MLSQFITKGTISSAVSIISFLLATTGHGALAAFVSDPNVLQNVFVIIGAVSAIHAGISDGVKVSSVPTPTAPPTAEDPYPGWDYDPLKGWVKK